MYLGPLAPQPTALTSRPWLLGLKVLDDGSGAQEFAYDCDQRHFILSPLKIKFDLATAQCPNLTS